MSTKVHMTRTATFSGTILIVAGFVATSLAAEPESTERRERLEARLVRGDLAHVAIIANEDHTFAVEISPHDEQVR